MNMGFTHSRSERRKQDDIHNILKTVEKMYLIDRGEILNLADSKLGDELKMADNLSELNYGLDLVFEAMNRRQRQGGPDFGGTLLTGDPDGGDDWNIGSGLPPFMRIDNPGFAANFPKGRSLREILPQPVPAPYREMTPPAQPMAFKSMPEGGEQSWSHPDSPLPAPALPPVQGPGTVYGHLNGVGTQPSQPLTLNTNPDHRPRPGEDRRAQDPWAAMGRDWRDILAQGYRQYEIDGPWQPGWDYMEQAVKETWSELKKLDLGEVADGAIFAAVSSLLVVVATGGVAAVPIMMSALVRAGVMAAAGEVLQQLGKSALIKMGLSEQAAELIVDSIDKYTTWQGWRRASIATLRQ